MARSRKHHCDGNATMRCLCIVHVKHTESVAMETQQFVSWIVALHMWLPKIWNTLRSSCKQTNIFVRI